MYTFRLNDQLCWCEAIFREIERYALSSDSEKPIIRVRLGLDLNYFSAYIILSSYLTYFS